MSPEAKQRRNILFPAEQVSLAVTWLTDLLLTAFGDGVHNLSSGKEKAYSTHFGKVNFNFIKADLADTKTLNQQSRGMISLFTCSQSGRQRRN